MSWYAHRRRCKKFMPSLTATHEQDQREQDDKCPYDPYNDKRHPKRDEEPAPPHDEECVDCDGLYNK